jgi:hypothetical protein
MLISRGTFRPEGNRRTLWFKTHRMALTGRLLGGTVTFWTGDSDADANALWEIIDAHLACLMERREFSLIPEPKLRPVKS